MDLLPPMRATLRRPATVVAGFALFIVASCGGGPESKGSMVVVSDDQKLAADRMFVRDPFDDQVKQGVLRQRMLGEIHFLPHSAELSNLGKRDLSILAPALAKSGDRLSVRRGESGVELRDARVATVRSELAKLGVAVVAVDDAPAGGPGIVSGDALLLLQESRSARWGTLNQPGIGAELKQGGSE